MARALRVSPLACAHVCTVVALAALVARPQAQATPAAGIFIEQPAGALDRLPSEMMSDIKPSNMALAMFGRLTYRGVLPAPPPRPPWASRRSSCSSSTRTPGACRPHPPTWSRSRR